MSNKNYATQIVLTPVPGINIQVNTVVTAPSLSKALQQIKSALDSVETTNNGGEK